MRQGFTLIEISIVLVIAGLIAGAVLVGQNLIASAELRAEITQIERYKTATNVFYQKYGYLPGDIPGTKATLFGFDPRGHYAGEGDGNGLLEGVDYNYPGFDYGWVYAAGETVMFWVDLSKVNLIDGTFATASSTSPASQVTGSSLLLYFPAAKIQGDLVYVYSTRAGTGGKFVNYLGLSGVKSINANGYGCISCMVSSPGLMVSQAFAIDDKLDDGLPTTGKVLAQYTDEASFGGSGFGFAPNASSPSATTCYDTVSGKYSTSVNDGGGLNCGLSFRLQPGS